MKTKYIEDDDLDTSERELSLSPSTLLGIFFLLAIVCAIFFGFGYSMGKRSAAPTVASAANTSDDDAPVSKSGDSKPAPGEKDLADGLTPADAAAASTPSEKFDEPAPAPAKTKPVVSETTPAPQPRVVTKPAPATPTPQPTPAVALKPPAPVATAPHATAAAAAGAPALVQIAAVSHQEDADMLIAALKRKGYTVAVRHEPQDKLLHIQLGPYPTRKDADAMRQRLIADGYNAIVK
ncbi:MAG TPA: SPOR domain-containing protein [Edaphobacter sp.]